MESNYIIKELTESDIPPVKQEVNFLLVAHGASTTTENLIYRTITKISNFHFFAPHGHILQSRFFFTGDLIEFIRNRELEKHFETFSTTIINDSYNTCDLPPMFWVGEPSYEPQMNLMGLYHIENNTYNKIFDNQFLLEHGRITYSIVEKQISDYFKTYSQNMMNFNINLYIYSCRETSIYFSDRLNPTYIITSEVDWEEPRVMEEPVKYRSIDSPQFENVMLVRFDTSIEYINYFIGNWSTALGQILHQGCGINILNFFGLLEVKDARNRVLVLYKTGTSIHKFMDYLWTCAFNSDDSVQLVAIRFNTIQRFIDYLSEVYRMNYLSESLWIPIKIYRNNFEVDSGMGHFIAFYKEGNNLYVIDPQQNIFKLDFIDYFSRFELNLNLIQCDAIFRKIPDGGNRNVILDNYRENIQFMERPTDLMWGGRALTQYNDYHLKYKDNFIEKNVQQNNEITNQKNLYSPTSTNEKIYTLNNEEYIGTKIYAKNHIQKTTYLLINRLLIDIYCDDEFKNNIPEDEKQNFKIIDDDETQKLDDEKEFIILLEKKEKNIKKAGKKTMKNKKKKNKKSRNKNKGGKNKKNKSYKRFIKK